MISFGPDTCGNLEAALKHEWLETNGLGGFASSTIIGLNTRRYHGLLVAATNPPVGRMVLLSKLEEVLLVDGRRYELSANQYPSTIHPQGFQFLKQFRLDPFPVFTFEVDGAKIEKTVFMVHGENTTVVEYRLLSSGAVNCHLEVHPLIAFRDYHSTTHENGVLDARVIEEPGLACVQPYAGLPKLFFAHEAAGLKTEGHWYRNFEYLEEQRRGLDWVEDLFNPFVLSFDLTQKSSATVIASTEKVMVSETGAYLRRELSRREALLSQVSSTDPFVRRLAAAADQFIVSRGEQKTVIAGYHWFGDWGRDTMIALPGLTLATGRPEIAKSILQTFARHVDQGMLPNRFPDAGEVPEYNTVDGALWLFEAARVYLEYTDDLEFLRTLYPVLADIVNWHVRGTRCGIKMEPTGLLAAGEPGVQLTWMDAKIGDWVVTPRHGKPVEIQALWYNALCIMRDLAQRLGDEASRKRYGNMAVITRWSFNRLFWNEEAGCLYDVVNGGAPDASIRPNQIFAVSLPHSMLSLERARKVVEVVEQDLLTPYGLRTLAPSDPRYRPHYEGGVFERDSAYHQGTVWPWLMGPFITGYMKVHGSSEEARERAAGWLNRLAELTCGQGLGQICEILDGDPPHRPCGCIAQAWSVAEILRAATEVIQFTPAKDHADRQRSNRVRRVFSVKIHTTGR